MHRNINDVIELENQAGKRLHAGRHLAHRFDRAT
jgi:hypothetical protein